MEGDFSQWNLYHKLYRSRDFQAYAQGIHLALINTVYSTVNGGDKINTEKIKFKI